MQQMKTMVNEPYVHHVPLLTGGVGYEGVHNFYKNDFVGKMPELKSCAYLEQ
jgi:carboxymethylenebutenolidase